MSTFAVIPAKGWSERFGGCKNLARWKGKTLLRYAIESAAGCDTRLVLTDSDAVADEASKCGAAIHLVAIRSGSTVLDTLRENLDLTGYDPEDVLALLLPTCPQRIAAHVRQTLTMLWEKRCDGIVSVCKLPWPADLACHLDPNDRSLRPASAFLTGRTRQQDQRNSYRPNGGVYLRTVSAWRRRPNFFEGRVWPYLMPVLFGADIDTREDLERLRQEWP